MADWSQLPTELLQLISTHLNSDLYLLRLRSVCSTWRSSIPIPNPNHHHHHHLNLPSKIPLFSNSINDSNSKSKTFSLSKRTLFLISPPPQNSTTIHRHHYPWLLKINNSNRKKRAVKFDVYRLDEKEKRWVELTSLGDRTLFLADDCAFFVSASDLGSIYKNCVIFRNNYASNHKCDLEMGVFDLGLRKPRDYYKITDLFWPPEWIRSHCR